MKRQRKQTISSVPHLQESLCWPTTMYSTNPISASTRVARKPLMEIHSLGRAFTNFSRQPLKTLNFSYGVSIGNLSKKYNTACGERAAFMMRLAASEPFEYVAISFVAARTTVVENCCKTTRAGVRIIHTTAEGERNQIRIKYVPV
jgi:hypothetical protein